jgi:hypothetical protein
VLFNLPLRCRCGHVHGIAREVRPSDGFRLICYCKDCQALARFLKRPDVLDETGGTDIFQTSPGRIKLSAGADAVRCLSFSGKVLRWYADCCGTPIANTAAGTRFPVLGLIHSFVSDEVDGRSRDKMFGLPLCRIHERSAIAPLQADAPPPATLRIVARRGAKVLGWWWQGLARPNPFFNDQTNAPLSVPHAITRGERKALERGNA